MGPDISPSPGIGPKTWKIRGKDGKGLKARFLLMHLASYSDLVWPFFPPIICIMLVSIPILTASQVRTNDRLDSMMPRQKQLYNLYNISADPLLGVKLLHRGPCSKVLIQSYTGPSKCGMFKLFCNPSWASACSFHRPCHLQT